MDIQGAADLLAALGNPEKTKELLDELEKRHAFLSEHANAVAEHRQAADDAEVVQEETQAQRAQLAVERKAWEDDSGRWAATVEQSKAELADREAKVTKREQECAKREQVNGGNTADLVRRSLTLDEREKKLAEDEATYAERIGKLKALAGD